MVTPVVRGFFSTAYRIWPSVSREALSQSLPLGALENIVQRKLAKERTFLFNGNELEYYFHSHNNFRMTERAIEIPVLREMMAVYPHSKILEIGNVSSYYYDAFRHVPEMAQKTVVDRYEEAAGVLNIDIAEFAPDSVFDFIFSISTFEHMDSDRGWNPNHQPGTSSLGSVAADNIKHVVDNLLAAEGVLVLTAPIGYSEEFDATFLSEELRELSNVTFRSYGFRKLDDLRWEQTSPANAIEALKKRPPFPEMNFIVVCEFQKKKPLQEHSRS